MAGNKKSMMDMSAELFEQARKKDKNSEEFNAVIQALIQINDYNKKKVSEVSMQDYMRAQKKLIDVCEQYTSKKSIAFSRDGRARMGLIGAICELAKSEDYRDIDASKLAKAGKTWGDASAESRIVKKDKHTDKVLGKAGAGTSQRNIYADGFYTPETKSMDYDAVSAVKKRIDQNPKDDVEKVVRYLFSEHKIHLDMSNPGDYAYAIGVYDTKVRKKDDIEKKEATIEKALAMINEIQKKETAAEAASSLALIPEGSSLTQRNVATSRLASLLGSESIVAKSVKMQVVDRSSGKEEVVSEGVIMATASGLDVNDIKTQGDFMYYKGMKNPKDPKDKMTVSPKFLKEATSLHVMDLIAGQTDRHGGNAFFKLESQADGLCLDGLIAIDNDMAFGVGSYGGSMKPAMMNLGDLSTLSHVDEELYSKVMSMDGEMLEYMLRDTIEPAAMEAAQKRLQEVKERLSSKDVIKVSDWSKVKTEEVKDRYAVSFSDQIKDRASEVYRIGKSFTDVFGIEMDDYLGMGGMKELADEYQHFQNSQKILHIGREAMPKGANLKNPELMSAFARFHAAYNMRAQNLAKLEKDSSFQPMKMEDIIETCKQGSRETSEDIRSSGGLLLGALTSEETMRTYVKDVLVSMNLCGFDSEYILPFAQKYKMALEAQYPQEANLAKIEVTEFLKKEQKLLEAQKEKKEASKEATEGVTKEATKEESKEATKEATEGVTKEPKEAKKEEAIAPQTSASPQKTQVKFKELTKEEKKDSVTSERKLRRRAVRFDKDELGKALAEEAKKDAGAVKPGPKGKK